MRSKEKGEPLYDQRVGTVCAAYRELIELYQTAGVHTICVDEQTGIQALERISQDRPVRADSLALREYEHRRPGALCLLNNLHVPTGRILASMIRQTRNAMEHDENLQRLIRTDPLAPYRLIVDNSTTHCPDSFVRYVAQVGQLADPLATKAVCGVLESVAGRVALLTDPPQRIQFLSTPRHCSWLNQIDIWFGTLRHKVTQWMRFARLATLEDPILSFIDYHNAHLAYPHNWTHTERDLPARRLVYRSAEQPFLRERRSLPRCKTYSGVRVDCSRSTV